MMKSDFAKVPKPKDILFTIIYDKEKLQILTWRSWKKRLIKVFFFHFTSTVVMNLVKKN